jgi:hypothetical protein
MPRTDFATRDDGSAKSTGRMGEEVGALSAYILACRNRDRSRAAFRPRRFMMKSGIRLEGPSDAGAPVRLALIAATLLALLSPAVHADATAEANSKNWSSGTDQTSGTTDYTLLPARSKRPQLRRPGAGTKEGLAARASARPRSSIPLVALLPGKLGQPGAFRCPVPL